MSRLEAAISAAGMTVFAKIDHGAAASAVHMALRTTELVIFGNAKGGTLLMQVDQAVGIDLPLKTLVYQDPSGKVWVTYNDPTWIAGRHGLGVALSPAVTAMTSALNTIIANATDTDSQG